MAIKDFYPAIRPTLDLNFAGSRIVDPRLSFSRSGTGSIASYFDEKGVMNFAPTNIPRIDFDPATLECKGLLIEEQRTNLLTYSEQFNNDAVWIKTNTGNVLNTAIAPNGLLSADKIIENTAASAAHNFYILSPVVSGTTYSFSIYAKKGERNHVLFSAGSSAFNANQALFDINNGTVSSIVGATASISNAGNGWYRCVVSLQAISTTTASFNLYLHNGSTHVYTGDEVSGIYVWGAQLEQGAFPTSYIPTTTAQVTRAADSASMSGANFSSWNNTTGTILAKYRNSGWQHNNTPPSTQLDLAKYIQDHNTSVAGDAIGRVMFYPRQLTEEQISALKG